MTLFPWILPGKGPEFLSLTIPKDCQCGLDGKGAYCWKVIHSFLVKTKNFFGPKVNQRDPQGLPRESERASGHSF